MTTTRNAKRAGHPAAPAAPYVASRTRRAARPPEQQRRRMPADIGITSAPTKQKKRAGSSKHHPLQQRASQSNREKKIDEETGDEEQSRRRREWSSPARRRAGLRGGWGDPRRGRLPELGFDGGFGRRGMGNRRIGRGGREKRWGRVNWNRGRGDV